MTTSTTYRGLGLTTLLLALGATATACGGDDEPGGTAAPAAGSPTTSPSATPSGSDAPTEAPVDASATTVPRLVQCLTQDGVLAGGAVDGRIWVTLSDGSEYDPVTGALHVLADEAAATAAADGLLADEIAAEEVPADTATVSVHGNVVQVLETEPGDTRFAQVLAGCVPGADPATQVRPPAAGTATVGSLMECAESAGLESYGEHSFFDISEEQSGTVSVRTSDELGYTEHAYLHVYPDATTAEARQGPMTGDEDPALFVRAGNVIARFPDAVDRSDAETAMVLGCLPA